MVEQLAHNIQEKDRTKIQSVFEDNANYFSKHNKHHSQYIKRLFNYYNNYFGEETIMWHETDSDCIDCQATIIKLWSTVIYEIWEREIV